MKKERFVLKITLNIILRHLDVRTVFCFLVYLITRFQGERIYGVEKKYDELRNI
jgi:hypothetical protein